MSGVSYHFGYNIPALEAIEKIVQGKEGKVLLAIISFDEVSLAPKPDFNTKLLAFDGFANLNTDPVRNRDEIDHYDGDGPRPETDVSETPVLADHALVLMVRPLLDKWVQPFGVFASAKEDLGKICIDWS